MGGVVSSYLSGKVISFASKQADGLVDQLLEKAVSFAKDQVSLVLDLDDEITFLKKVLPKLKEMILNAEVKSEEMAEFHGGLKDFVEDAEDIVDEFDAELAQRSPSPFTDRHRNRTARWFMVLAGVSVGEQRLKTVVKLVRGCIPSSLCFDSSDDESVSLIFCVKIANEIKGLYEGLGNLKSSVERMRQFVASAEEGLLLVKKQTPEDESLRRPVTDGLLTRDFRFVGRKNVKEEVMGELLSDSLCKPSVILVTGMGGIGKTTLVQDILRHPQIVERFELKKWVCVGDELHPGTVMGAILGKDRGGRSEIRSELEGKRFLIVLDDCWSGKLAGWKELWDPLTFGSDGSKVIITCRENVSKELEPALVKSCKLNILPMDECLQIFESCAFPGGVPSSSSGCGATSRLREIGKEIVAKKIRGLPLAARVLGCSLRYEIQESAWNNVLTGVSDENNITSVLMWSYRRLPSHLKQCFSYLSMFPKDYRLHRKHVVLMWMAHGYVNPMDNLTLEYVGEKYFDELVRASLIQKEQENSEDSDLWYKMHDMIHDLAVIVTGGRGGYFPGNTVAAENYVPPRLEISRHLLIEDDSSFEKYSGSNKKLRTLVSCCEHANSSKFELEHVRVLSLSGREDLSRISFSKMIHLHYLDLTGVETVTLPESICGIYNLQTLLLNKEVQNFPLGMWKLPNLRHLMGGEQIRMAGISNSASLQAIGNFNLFIGGEDVEELGNLRQLRGKLKINHLNHVQSSQYASKARLDHKEYVEELVLKWDDEDSPRMSGEMQNAILESLRPHGNLRILKIKKYMGDRSPRWMRGRYLPNLVRLTLSDLHHMEELPPLGHLPKLECLHIKDSSSIRCIGNEFYGTEAYVFPSLKELHLENMVRLEEWMEYTFRKDQIPTWFPSLEELSVTLCKKFRSLPPLPKLVKQLTIGSTGMRILPEVWTCGNDANSYELPHLATLQIRFCPSLCPDEWFRKYRLPSLGWLRLRNVNSCADLVVNYSRKCLRNLVIENMPALESITLRNLVPVEEFGEADYPQLYVQLRILGVLKDISIVNSEDGKITAGPLSVEAVGCNPAPVLQENISKFKRDAEYNVRNEVELTMGDWISTLVVNPRKLICSAES